MLENNNQTPFIIMRHDDCCSLILNQENFHSKLFHQISSECNLNNGYDYENLIKAYVDKKLPHLARNLNYDSEAGMFCVYLNRVKELKQLANSFLQDVKNEKEMLELTPYLKEYSSYYGY